MQNIHVSISISIETENVLLVSVKNVCKVLIQHSQCCHVRILLKKLISIKNEVAVKTPFPSHKHQIHFHYMSGFHGNNHDTANLLIHYTAYRHVHGIFF